MNIKATHFLSYSSSLCNRPLSHPQLIYLLNFLTCESIRNIFYLGFNSFLKVSCNTSSPIFQISCNVHLILEARRIDILSGLCLTLAPSVFSFFIFLHWFRTKCFRPLHFYSFFNLVIGHRVYKQDALIKSDLIIKIYI